MSIEHAGVALGVLVTVSLIAHRGSEMRLLTGRERREEVEHVARMDRHRVEMKLIRKEERRAKKARKRMKKAGRDHPGGGSVSD